MKKTLAFTFILGALTGSAVTLYFSGNSSSSKPTGENASSDEQKEPSREMLNGDVLDIPEESVNEAELAGIPHKEDTAPETSDASSRHIPTQAEMFERSARKEEDLSSLAPEESPNEEPYDEYEDEYQ